MNHLAEQHIHLPDPPTIHVISPDKDRWPKAHSEMVRSMVEGKQHSCQQIAYSLNRAFGTSYTRSAIIGRIHRMGLSHSPEKKARVKRVKGAKPLREPKLRIVAANGNSNVLRLATSVTSKVGELRLADVTPLNLTLAELPDNGCRYITGEPTGACYCGHIQLKGYSYCEPHKILCWVAPLPRRQIYRGFK